MPKDKPTLVIGIGKPKDDAGDSGPSSSDYSKGGDEDVAADELADCLSVPDDKRDDFKSALSSYVALCVHKELGDSNS